MRWSVVVAVAFGSLIACGGSPPQATTPAPAPSATQGPVATAPAPTSPPVEAPAPQPTLESQREPFVKDCMSKMQAAEYCSCSFEQLKESFKDSDLTKTPADDDPRLVALREKTLANCSSKLPEDLIRARFVKECTGDDARKTKYCECAWPALRKTLSVADFLGDFTGARFEDAKKNMVGACKGKYPAEVAKADFIDKLCSRGDATKTKPCACLWTKLRGKYSTEQIISGMADPATVPGADQCKNAH